MNRLLLKRLRLGLYILVLLLALFGGLIAATQGGGRFDLGRDDLMGVGYWFDKNRVTPRNQLWRLQLKGGGSPVTYAE